MKSPHIHHPENNHCLQLHEWMVKFCGNNHCAALLLAFFLSWHEWRLRHDIYYRRLINTEIHKDVGINNENAYLFFTFQELIDGLMGLYDQKTVASALDLLVSLGVISTHKNLNSTYPFDKTKYFKLYPHVCDHWLANNYQIAHCTER